MQNKPINDSDCAATATGVLRCLAMLADEAASLRMERTVAALRQAIRVCAAENQAPELADGFHLLSWGPQLN